MSVIQHPTSNIQDPSPHCSGFAVLIGRPGVGKSTLLNRLVGQKVAITAAVSQITRTRLSGILTLPYTQIVFVDTPGLHRPRHRLGEWMVEQSVRALRDADVVLLVLDAGDGVTPEDRAAIARLGGVRAPALAVLNKIDRLPPGEMLRAIGQRARGDIETLLHSRIYLDLWVKTSKGWREREELIKTFYPE